MCISPVRIRNPNYGKTGKGYYYKDCKSLFLSVPCGFCHECIKSRQMQFVQRLQMEELTNHLFFCTLTYNNESLPQVVTSTGYNIRFADVSDVQKMFKRLRKSNAFGRPFRHFSVSELGSDKGRPHFHILFLIPKHDGDTIYDCMNLEKRMFDAVLSEWRRNYGSNRKPIWKPCCSYVRKFIRGRLRTNFDLHYVNPMLSDGGCADVAFYVMKYMLKPSDRVVRLQRALRLNLPEDEYDSLWKMVKPRHFESEAIGYGQCVYDKPSENDGFRRKYYISPDVLSHLKRGIDLSKYGASDKPFPQFFTTTDGKSFPLARFYKNNPEIFSQADFLDFYFMDKNSRSDNVVIADDVHVSQLVKGVDDFDKKVKQVEFQQSSDELDDLFEPLSDDLFTL